MGPVSATKAPVGPPCQGAVGRPTEPVGGNSPIAEGVNKFAVNVGSSEQGPAGTVWQYK